MWSMNHPSRLIPPPLVGSFKWFTSPTRGSAETPLRPNSESQEDREGPQLTSSDQAVPGRLGTALFSHVRCLAPAVAFLDVSRGTQPARHERAVGSGAGHLATETGPQEPRLVPGT